MSQVEAGGTGAGPVVLVVEDDPDIRELLRLALEGDGLGCVMAPDGETALDLARSERPALVLLDLALPGISGEEVHERLRADRGTMHVPIICVTATANAEMKVERLLAGADDYITKPFEVSELIARSRVALRRAATLRGLNPLSGLPGNAAILDEIGRRLEGDEAFACLHVDLDRFKIFNDHHGFARGDAVITALARAIAEAADASPCDPFVGHIGGDDFIAVTAAEDAEPLAASIARAFDARSAGLHDAADARRGWFESVDRRGVRKRVPLLSLSIGVAFSTRGHDGAVAIAQAAAEMKAVAKRSAGSSWAVDRRRA